MLTPHAVHADGDFDCVIDDISEEVGLLALQGPQAFDIIAEVTDMPVADVKYYHFMRPEPGAFLGCEKAILSHTGYTGEKGLEIYCEAERVEAESVVQVDHHRGEVVAGDGAQGCGLVGPEDV